MLRSAIRIENLSCFPLPATSCTKEELPDDTKETDIYSTEGEEEPNDPGEDPPADGN